MMNDMRQVKQQNIQLSAVRLSLIRNLSRDTKGEDVKVLKRFLSIDFEQVFHRNIHVSKKSCHTEYHYCKQPIIYA